MRVIIDRIPNCLLGVIRTAIFGGILRYWELSEGPRLRFEVGHSTERMLIHRHFNERS